MKLDYSVDLTKKDDEKKLSENNLRTRTSMQSTVMGALSSRLPQGAAGPMAQPAQQTGWGATGV